MVFLQITYHETLGMNNKLVLYFQGQGTPVSLRFGEHGDPNSDHEVEKHELSEEEPAEVGNGIGILNGHVQAHRELERLFKTLGEW